MGRGNGGGGESGTAMAGRAGCRACGIWLAACWLLACLPAYGGTAKPATPPEYLVKAAFLYNFTGFVNWPHAAGKSGIFTLCVLGKDPFEGLLDKLAGKPVQDSRLVVRRVDNPAALVQCQLAFIGATSSEQLHAALSLLGTRPVLTVSDIHGFAEQGGIIEFRVIANKIRFAVNLDAAEHAGLSISSKLLNLASNFRDKD